MAKLKISTLINQLQNFIDETGDCSISSVDVNPKKKENTAMIFQVFTEDGEYCNVPIKFTKENIPFIFNLEESFSGKITLKDPILGRIKKGIKNIDSHFNNHPDYEQIDYIQQGNIYSIFAIEGHGDVYDFWIHDDSGLEKALRNDFFEPVL